MLNLIKILDEKLIFPLRFKRLAKILGHYLEGSKRVLDLGASDGKLAETIQKDLDIEFFGIDTHPQPKKSIPVIKYNGKKIPFKNNSFDCVMVVDVLHHDKNPHQIIKEAKRVSKKYILIKDHYFTNKVDFALLKFADYMGNKPYGVSLPYNFLNIEAWNNLIKANNLIIIKSQKYRSSIFFPIKHIILKLRSKNK